MLTADELGTIRARAEAATPGPWVLWDAVALEDGNAQTGRIGPLHSAEGLRASRPPDYGIESTIADAELIAAARSDIPALLAHIAAQAAQIDAMRPIVTAVATMPWPTGYLMSADPEDGYPTDDDVQVQCPWREECADPAADYGGHAADCPVTLARAVEAALEGSEARE